MAQKESYLTATSRDTIRSRSVTGKPARMLRNKLDRGLGIRRQKPWTPSRCRSKEWSPWTWFGVPIQYAEKAQDVAFNPVGQIVGIDEPDPPRPGTSSPTLIDGYYDALDRLQSLSTSDLKGARKR